MTVLVKKWRLLLCMQRRELDRRPRTDRMNSGSSYIHKTDVVEGDGFRVPLVMLCWGPPKPWAHKGTIPAFEHFQ